MGHKIRKIADPSLKQGSYVAGANKEGYHVKGVTADKNFSDAESADIHLAAAGDACVQCGKPLRIERVIEVGNIFKLGTKYSVPLKANYLDENGNEQPIIMGSYGIGPARIAAAAIEQGNDVNGIIWPLSIAPHQVLIVPVNVTDTRTMDTAEEIYAALEEKGFEVLLDDRDERLAGQVAGDQDEVHPFGAGVGNDAAEHPEEVLKTLGLTGGGTVALAQVDVGGVEKCDGHR